MSAKLCLIFAIFCVLSMQTLSLSVNQRLNRSPRSTDKNEIQDDDKNDGTDGLKLGSQQNSQSTSEKLGKDGSYGLQQHNQGQQQLAAVIGKAHYVLQQQTSMGQQLAQLGKKTAIQQLVDIQKQAVANGKVEKSSKVDFKESEKEADTKDG